MQALQTNGHRFVLTLSCDDKPGLTAAVTSTLARHGGNILDAQQYRDPLSIRFFMRIVFELHSETVVEPIRAELPRAMHATGLDWRLRPADERGAYSSWCRASTIAWSTCCTAIAPASSTWTSSASSRTTRERRSTRR